MKFPWVLITRVQTSRGPNFRVQTSIGVNVLVEYSIDRYLHMPDYLMLHFPQIIILEQKYRHTVYDVPDRKSLQQVLPYLCSSVRYPHPRFIFDAVPVCK